MEYDKFGEAIEAEDRINGISLSEMAMFIEHNEERYIGIFKKNADRKFFLHINWTALIFPIYWLFYRKMYKQGVVFLLCLGVFSALVLSVGMVFLRDDILAIREQQYQAIFYESEYAAGNPDAFREYFADSQSRLRQMEQNFNHKLFCFIVLPFVAFALIFGLLADCLYRDHVFKKIRFSDGGVSRTAILGALGLMVGYNFIMDIIQKSIMNIILK